MKLHYEIDGKDFSAAGEASSALKKVLKQLSVDPMVIRRVAIAMYEAEINTVIHANGGYVDVEISPEFVKMTFVDNGPGIENIDLAMQEGYSTATTKIQELGFGAGMGLPNMKRYTDEMNVTSALGKGTKVEMVVRIA
jgi:serine/threonine-protein kinase RsbT